MSKTQTTNNRPTKNKKKNSIKKITKITKL